MLLSKKKSVMEGGMKGAAFVEIKDAYEKKSERSVRWKRRRTRNTDLQEERAAFNQERKKVQTRNGPGVKTKEPKRKRAEKPDVRKDKTSSSGKTSKEGLLLSKKHRQRVDLLRDGQARKEKVSWTGGKKPVFSEKTTGGGGKIYDWGNLAKGNHTNRASEPRGRKSNP